MRVAWRYQFLLNTMIIMQQVSHHNNKLAKNLNLNIIKICIFIWNINMM